MSYYHPIQKLCYIDQSHGGEFLLAATGPNILSLDLKHGGIISKWPDDAQALEKPRNGDTRGSPIDDDSPRKRRKVSPSQAQEEQQSRESSVSVEFVSERAKGQRRKKKKIVQSTLPNVSQIISTTDGRCMPKRLCAIALTRNENTILAGDKFGDVYALPLHPSSDSKAMPPTKPQLEIPKPFKPSASELTVHTKGNREALRQQQLHKAAASKKQEPTFEHQLILGHVSTLTDLLVAIDASNSNREYVLTADRDEHVRVSRGIPQAHIINNYCLGHTDFVSWLCIVPEQPQFLISGDGEPSLRIFDWQQGTTVAQAKVDHELKRLVTDGAFSCPPEPNEKRAVSCIRALRAKVKSDSEEVIITMVALEGTPAVFTYLFYPENRVLKPDRAYPLPANVLDIALLKVRGVMLISLDNVHSPMSTKQALQQNQPPTIRAFFLSLNHRDGDWQYEWVGHEPAEAGSGSEEPGDIASELERTLQSEEVRHEIEFEEAVKPKALYSSLGDFLYGLENLRKKSYAEGDGQQMEDAAAMNPEEE